jgi:hypothetical protein
MVLYLSCLPDDAVRGAQDAGVLELLVISEVDGMLHHCIVLYCIPVVSIFVGA